MALNVLITSAAAKVPLIRAMQEAARRIDPEAKVIAGDVDTGAVSRYVADDFWAMPSMAEVSPEGLLEACQDRTVDVVLPTRDGELGFWAEARVRFAAAGIGVIVSDPTSVQRTLDKLAFANAGAALGLPVITAALAPEGSGPFVVKERFGAGSRSVGLKLDAQAALTHGATLDAPIYQAFVEGPEISIDGWMDDAGEPRGVVLRRRDRAVGGESQVTTTFRDAPLEANAMAAFRALKLRGPAVMQAILTDTGLAIIECNARFGGASTAGVAAGLDSLYWSLLEHRSPDARPAFKPAVRPIRQVRVAQDIILHDPDL